MPANRVYVYYALLNVYKTICVINAVNYERIPNKVYKLREDTGYCNQCNHKRLSITNALQQNQLLEGIALRSALQESEDEQNF